MKADERVSELTKLKKISREFLRSLSPDEKVEKLVALQEQYYSMLALREANGGKPIPNEWHKWYAARHGSKNE
jgi:hypothetical protein